jgi:hypothetical protein
MASDHLEFDVGQRAHIAAVVERADDAEVAKPARGRQLPCALASRRTGNTRRIGPVEAGPAAARRWSIRKSFDLRLICGKSSRSACRRRQHDRPEDGVLQLPDVAGPVIGFQQASASAERIRPSPGGAPAPGPLR